MVDFDVAVILPAAGRGERMESLPIKQCREILNKPLFMYPVEEFYLIPWVKKIVLVIHDFDIDEEELLRPYREKILIAFGGATRHQSIKAGVLALQKDKTCIHIKVVVVHDAVRPFVPPDLVEQLVKAAYEYGSAGAVRPLTSTILKPNSEGFLEKTLDRNEYVSSETPQAFQFHVLCNAYKNCPDEELEKGTECLKLAHLYAGARPKLIEGPTDLWKITYKKDYYSAVGCLLEKRSRVCVVATMLCASARLLEAKLKEVVSKVEYMTSIPAKDSPQASAEVPFSSVVIFYQNQLRCEGPPLDYENESVIPRSGLLIRVIDCMRPSVWRHNDFPEKGVVVIRRSTSRCSTRLVSLILTMAMAPPDTFSQQLLFM